MTAEQLHELALRQEVEKSLGAKFAAQLAEKDRILTEMGVYEAGLREKLAEKEREIARLQGLIKPEAELHNERQIRLQAAGERLQEAQALNKRQMEAQLAMAEKERESKTDCCADAHQKLGWLEEKLRQREAELEQLRKHLYLKHGCGHEEYVYDLMQPLPAPPKEGSS